MDRDDCGADETWDKDDCGADASVTTARQGNAWEHGRRELTVVTSSPFAGHRLPRMMAIMKTVPHMSPSPEGLHRVMRGGKQSR